MTPIRIIVALVLAILLVAGITYFVRNDVPESGTETETVPEPLTYENQTHGYSLTYPGDLEVREYSTENAVFGEIEGDAIEGVAEVSILAVTGTPGQTMISAVSEQLQTLCASDGADMTFSCTGVATTTPFTTTAGVAGTILLLRGELHDFTSNKTAVMGKGPYFVIPLQSGATGSKALVVHPPLNQYAEQAASSTIRTIAESVQLYGSAAITPAE